MRVRLNNKTFEVRKLKQLPKGFYKRENGILVFFSENYTPKGHPRSKYFGNRHLNK